MNEIKRLRVFIIFLVTGIMAGILAFILFVLNVSMTVRLYNQAYEHLELMAKNGGLNRPFKIPDGPRPELNDKFNSQNAPLDRDSQFRPKPKRMPPVHNKGDMMEIQQFLMIRPEMNLGFRSSFCVRLDKNFEVLKIISEDKKSIDDEMIEQIQQVARKGTRRQHEDGFFYCVYPENEETTLVCVMNRFSEMQSLKQLYLISVAVYCGSVVVALLLALFFSKLITKPIKLAFERQKRFISDSSHELRTPISVIDANLAVVLNEQPDNKWLKYIQEENQRMGKLVTDLLYLTRNDQNRQRYHFDDINLSEAISNAVLPFESVIFEAGKKLELNIQKNVRAYADESAVKQAVTILVDNAIKYSNKGGHIKVNVFTDGSRKILKVYNTGSSIKKENLERVFDRFFREDTSRTGPNNGYGLGLSIAASIARLNGGSISCDSDGLNWVEFTMKFR
ncbi:MAG: HAMP domain-containing histidine kinase [Treponema sp.]|nr:HAMP domain-containing histidine kinase [Treponema sp.]